MTSLADAWHAYRERWERFSKTELGRLYLDYNNACIAYWRVDADEEISPRRLAALDMALKTAARALSEKLMELEGV
jgi:hypothetical protein